MTEFPRTSADPTRICSLRLIVWESNRCPSPDTANPAPREPLSAEEKQELVLRRKTDAKAAAHPGFGALLRPVKQENKRHMRPGDAKRHDRVNGYQSAFSTSVCAAACLANRVRIEVMARAD